MTNHVNDVVCHGCEVTCMCRWWWVVVVGGRERVNIEQLTLTAK